MSQAVYHGRLRGDAEVVSVIMAGGQGTRFWPASRRQRPKQFLALAGNERSLIQATAERLAPLSGPGALLVVTAEEQLGLVREHLPEAAVLCEPIPRNTAPCIGYAAVRTLADVGDVPMVCVPADHIITGNEALLGVFREAIALARARDVLVTVGIEPTAPETGYGYIQAGAPLSGSSGFSVERFVEKPDLETATGYIASGNYFWNSGIFIWRPSVVLQAIRQFLPALGAELELMAAAIGTPREAAQTRESFARLESISVDYGIMEHAKNVVILPGAGFGWSDVGSWSAWAECLAKTETSDKDNNLTKGQAVLVDSRDSVVVAEGRLVAVVGCSDLIVVETGDAVLVCRKDRAQDVKKVVDTLKSLRKDELL